MFIKTSAKSAITHKSWKKSTTFQTCPVNVGGHLGLCNFSAIDRVVDSHSGDFACLATYKPNSCEKFPQHNFEKELHARSRSIYWILLEMQGTVQ